MVIIIGVAAVSGKGRKTPTKVHGKKTSIAIEPLILQNLRSFEVFVEVRKDIASSGEFVFELFVDLFHRLRQANHGNQNGQEEKNSFQHLEVKVNSGLEEIIPQSLKAAPILRVGVAGGDPKFKAEADTFES